MANSTRVRDVFVKFNRYFKDLYILGGTTFCAGDDSDHDNDGFYYGILNDKGVGLLSEQYGKHPLMYIDDLRLIKDDLDQYKVIENPSAIQKKQHFFETLYNKSLKLDNWSPLSFRDEEFEKLLNGEVIEFVYAPERKPVNISRSIFPSMNRTTLEHTQYAWEEHYPVDGILRITFKVPLEYITLFMDYYFFE